MIKKGKKYTIDTKTLTKKLMHIGDDLYACQPEKGIIELYKKKRKPLVTLRFRAEDFPD